ncbi:hypothetical protein LP416_02270 [Polaromonas sp. P2-4]|nr:hypothetical protein LP416_02270 [Polaromonas sp. P2-4]
MKHIRVMPVMVTALSAEQVKADLASAEEIGVLVLTKENLGNGCDELLRFPDENRLF